MKTNSPTRLAFTMIELMVTILIVGVVIIAISGVLADAHRGYRETYERVYGDVTTQAYTSRITFDRICRKSSNSYNTNTGTDELYVYYYSAIDTTNAPIPDRYAHFYTNNAGSLMLDQGPANISGPNDIVLQTANSSQALAINVTSAEFLQTEASNCTQMILTLDDGKQGLTVTCSSVRHN